MATTVLEGNHEDKKPRVTKRMRRERLKEQSIELAEALLTFDEPELQIRRLNDLRSDAVEKLRAFFSLNLQAEQFEEQCHRLCSELAASMKDADGVFRHNYDELQRGLDDADEKQDYFWEVQEKLQALLASTAAFVSCQASESTDELDEGQDQVSLNAADASDKPI